MTTTVQSTRIGRLLEPRSIAIIGASPRNHIARSVLKNLRDFGYSGDIYPVNPNYEDIEGLRCYPEVGAIGTAPDAVVLLVPADAAPGAAAQAVAAGAGAIIVMSAGFAEDERGGGKERDRALRAAVEGSEVAVSGPNSEGYYNVLDGIALSFSGSVGLDFVEQHAARLTPDEDAIEIIKGPVAVVAQSGGLGFSLFGRGIERGIGFSHVVSVGNELDVDVLECADFLLDKPEVTVVAMYVEGFRSPERLRPLARKAHRLGKSIIIGKAGNSSSGSKAALSHTGHLAGEAQVNEAIFAELGIVSVDDQEELLDACAALAVAPRSAGARVGVVSWSGGSAVWTADACERAGLSLPEIGGALRDELTATLPEFAAIRNPIDITGAATLNPVQVLTMIGRSDDFDGFVLIAPLGSPVIFGGDVSQVAAIPASGKPVVAYSYTDVHPQNFARLARIGIPVFESSTRAARALRLLDVSNSRPAEALELASPPLSADRRVLSERETTALLQSAGFPVARQSLAHSADEAVVAAALIGKPVAMKVQAPSMPHKKDAGGVELGVFGDEAVRAAYDALIARTAAFSDVEGVLVQEMIPEGIEMIVGLSNDSGFGPVLMIGFGGSGVEHLSDTTLLPVPVSARAAREMIARLRHGALLTEPLAGLPRLDAEAVIDFIVKLSDWAVANCERLVELDVNPLIVSANGVTLVDSMMVAVAE